MADMASREQRQIRPTSSSSVTVIEHPAEVHLFQVTEDMLDSITETGLGRNLYLVFAAALFGAVMSLLAVWLTVDLKDATQSATLNATLIGLTILLALCATLAARDYRRSRQTLRLIKGQQT